VKHTYPLALRPNKNIYTMRGEFQYVTDEIITLQTKPNRYVDSNHYDGARYILMPASY
jgi:hypothetical protein